MRDLPARSSEIGHPPFRVTADDGLIPDQTLIEQWMDDEETSSDILKNRRFLSHNQQHKVLF